MYLFNDDLMRQKIWKKVYAYDFVASPFEPPFKNSPFKNSAPMEERRNSILRMISVSCIETLNFKWLFPTFF